MPYKEFANGNPLPASDIDTYLMDQAVMTFANSTARSTAIPSPKEGMLTYLEDTGFYEGWTGSAWVNINDNSNAILKSTVTTAGDLIVADGNASVTRLGIGTNGQVLQSNGTTAIWGTPSGGGGLDLISTTTLTGATVTLSSIPQTYINLYIAVENFKPSADGDLMKMTFNSHTTYANISYTDASQNNVGFTNADLTLSRQADDTVVSNFAYAYIYDYTSTRWKIADLNSISVAEVNNSNFNLRWSKGYANLASAITSINFFTTAGTFTGGTVKLYGVK